jgi:hypothetical protein
MPNRSHLIVKPPIGGMVKTTAYQSQPPFSSYSSMNMWPIDVLTGRAIMATRPPLETIPSPTGPCTLLTRVNGFATGKPYQSFIGAFNSDVYWWNGTGFTAATGSQASSIPTTRAVYAKVYLEEVFIGQTSSKPLVFNYDAGTVETMVETAGTAPSDCRIVETWKGALWLAGQLATPHILYGSRVGDPRDWDSSVPLEDTGGAFATTGDNAGLLNGPITAVMPHTSDVMIVSTIEGLVAMRGHPRDGGIFNPIEGSQYVLGQGAWCKGPGDVLYMLTPLGIMSLEPGSSAVPTPVSKKKIPEELLGLTYDYTDPKVSMIFDSRWNGIHILIRGAQEQGWFYNMTTGGFDRMQFNGYPFIVMEFPPFMTDQTNGIIYGGQILQHMDKFGSETVESGSVFGPIKLTEYAHEKARINSCRVILGRDTPTVVDSTIGISVGADGQDAINRIEIGTHQFTANLETAKDNNGVLFPHISGHAAGFTVAQSSGSLAIEELELSVEYAGANLMTRSPQIPIEGDPIDVTDPGNDFDDENWVGYSENTPAVPNCTLPDHTLFIDLQYLPTAWWDAVNSIGGDIRATDNVNNQLPVDVIEFNKIAKTGFMVVKITQQSPPTPVRLWVGNANVGPEAPASTFGQYNAYDTNWKAFYPSGGFNDRTVNLNHLTMTNQVDATCLSAGPIGNQATEYDFIDATNNYGRATAVVPSTYPVTFVVVAFLDTSDPLPCMGMRDNSGPTATNMEITANRTALIHRTDAGSTNTTLADEAQSGTLTATPLWRHCAATIVAADSRKAYLDGGNLGTNTTTITIAGGVLDEIIIGKGSRSGLSSASTPNKLTLAQLHDTERSACWVDYQFRMLDQVTFWGPWGAFIPVNPLPDPDDPGEVGTWSGYATATPISPSSNQTNWVHWIDLSRLPAAWWTAVSATGVDIRATDQSNIFIPIDVIDFDKVGSTGFATVKLSQPSTQAFPIRIWVGNATAITLPPATSYGRYNVYDSSYRGFWPSGGGADRTASQNTLTMVGATAGGVSGPIGNKATNYNGSSQYGHGSSNTIDSYPLALAAVVKPANITSKMASVSLNRTVFLGHSTLCHDVSAAPARIECRAYNQTAFAGSDVPVVPPTNWYHEVGFAASNRVRGCIVNGDGPDAASETSIRLHDYTRVSVGARLSGTSTIFWPWNGDISLVSIHSTTRGLTNAWADYQYEMLTQATFWAPSDWAWVAEVSSLPQ